MAKGEAVNDVTSEALGTELLPPSQYQASAPVTSAVFLLGGLIKFMIIWPEIHIYYFDCMYLVELLLVAVPPLLVLQSVVGSGPHHVENLVTNIHG